MANFGLGDSVAASNLVSRSSRFVIVEDYLFSQDLALSYSTCLILIFPYPTVFSMIPSFFYFNDPTRGILASVEKGIKGGIRRRRMSRERKEGRKERWAA